jgi:ABC-type Fe3+-hydroxamate transport system substrate-binding protein
MPAQIPASAQDTGAEQDKVTIQPTPSALAAYTKWRAATLPNYAQREATPHYAIAVVAQRLGDATAQVEVLVAADMKHSVLTIRPVTLARQPSGEVTVTPVVGRAVVVDLKAGRKVTTGPDAIRLAETATIVPVTRQTQALEITWEPKNDKKDDPSNTVLVLLGREPKVAVNGYIEGAPVR